MDGLDLVGFEDQIIAALLKERIPEEAERGLIHWYHGSDSVDEKVHSAVFNVEEREGRLWGVAECQVKGELTPGELNTLAEKLSELDERQTTALAGLVQAYKFMNNQPEQGGMEMRF